MNAMFIRPQKEAVFFARRKNYHVTEYLAKASHAVYPKKSTEAERRKWLSERCSLLKHKENSSQIILDELKAVTNSTLPESVKKYPEATVTYFSNNIKKTK